MTAFLRGTIIFIFLFLIRNASADDAVSGWTKLQAQWEEFESAGHFSHVGKNGVQTTGTFKWSCGKERFFCDVRLDKEGQDTYFPRVTTVFDGERIGQCIFSDRISKGCDTKVYDADSTAYLLVIPSIDLRFNLASKNFLPNPVLDGVKRNGGAQIAAFSNQGISYKYTLDGNFDCALTELTGTIGEKTVVVEKFTYKRDDNGRVIPTSKYYKANLPTGELFRESLVIFDKYAPGQFGCTFSFDDLDICGTSNRVIVNDGDKVRSFIYDKTQIGKNTTINTALDKLVEKKQAPSKTEPTNSAWLFAGIFFLMSLAGLLARQYQSRS